MQVSFEQVVYVVSAMLLTMAGAVGIMFKWILSRFKDVEDALTACHESHNAVSAQAAKLEGQMQELQRHNPTDLAAQVSHAVVELLNAKGGKP